VELGLSPTLFERVLEWTTDAPRGREASRPRVDLVCLGKSLFRSANGHIMASIMDEETEIREPKRLQSSDGTGREILAQARRSLSGSKLVRLFGEYLVYALGLGIAAAFVFPWLSDEEQMAWGEAALFGLGVVTLRDVWPRGSSTGCRPSTRPWSGWSGTASSASTTPRTPPRTPTT
jgi:hypothetical protein